VIRDLVQVAYDHGAVFLLETYVNNVVGSVNETLRVFAEIDHSSLGLLMDPTTYFEAHNIGDMDGELNRVFNALSDKIKIAHAKDVKLAGADKSEKHAELFEGAAESHTFRGVGQIELPAPGLGSLNYDLYLQRLSEHHPNVPIIIEHLDESDVPRAKKFLDGKLHASGLMRSISGRVSALAQLRPKDFGHDMLHEGAPRSTRSSSGELRHRRSRRAIEAQPKPASRLVAPPALITRAATGCPHTRTMAPALMRAPVHLAVPRASSPG
jgi:hypothetical protein